MLTSDISITSKMSFMKTLNSKDPEKEPFSTYSQREDPILLFCSSLMMIFWKISKLFKYHFPSNKCSRCLFNFEALRCGACWRVALKIGKSLFQSKRSYLPGILKLFKFLFPITLINYHYFSFLIIA